ncbi:uncharacterized protein BXIN_1822 [Babesia sp. Xinjiang]|uniref:uncharacterized protein n=1 Tax=Babesia sp. Xinjiang TaxID=462227 RepID=UPI000A224118|nr:uncharacterized protein BXIN_1269 [Babesia sp. Xinjiang]XP_028870510.1 uncharacterized protein BXIN_1267 [Babesia sp. Xinjiang]XP_028872622.1 uncharacterized protein BXIN_1822 [Babesia sp. Xinjiang]ORM40046.1 hypothetical protein BXIN_1269 [Babesia sp. Xinjiang]ORM40054.1 hypothetical protein BXIN_1267 [Babesia sp. Xinjiang]ORM42166.1 hypothetical protein BXIN_1822 [Babesia sp. Xinjiang]
MIRVLSVPALLCSGFFLYGGVYAYVSKKSLVSLLVAAAFSGLYAGSAFVIMSQAERHLGYCLAATVSLTALSFGAYRLFSAELPTASKRNWAIGIYSAGLASACFYVAVLCAKKAFEKPASLHLKGS